MKTTSASKRFFIRLILLVAGLLILAAAGLAVVGIAFGDKVKAVVVDEINSHLLVKADVRQIDFTIFSSFPDASVLFRNAEFKPPAGLPDAPGLLSAASISVRIGLFSLFTGTYKIRSLQITDASITLWTGADGHDNYHIWKQTGGKGSSVDFDLQRVVLVNSGVYYRNLIKQTDLAFFFPEFSFKGRMAGEQYDLQMAGGFQLRRWNTTGFSYAPASPVLISGVVHVNNATKQGSIRNLKVGFAGLEAVLDGNFDYGKEENPVYLNLQTSNADISEVLGALPDKLSEPFNVYEPGGRLALKATIKGKLGKTSTPFIHADFELSKGTFSHTGTGAKLKNIVLRGDFSSTAGKKAEVLTFSSFSGETQHGRFSGSARISDFSRPNLDLRLSADLDLAEVAGFMTSASVDKPAGRVIADLTYRGKYNDGARMAVTSQGLIRFENTSFELTASGTEVTNINGSLELKNGRVYIDQLQGKTGETDISLTGSADNLIAFMLYDNQPLHADTRLTSSVFRLEDIPGFQTASGATSEPGPVFPGDLSFTTSIQIEKFSYRKFSATNIRGTLTLSDQVLRADDLAFNALDGRIAASGLLNGRYGDHAQVVCNAELRDVDIPRLFSEFNDFGQTSLQSRHLRGRGDASVQYSSALSRNFETDEASVAAIADVEIRNGQLTGFEPLQELSGFVDEEELRNVRFSTMRNRIEIARKTVVIPEMEIQTSALNLKGYGSHTFGNEIDYHFSLLTSELRKNKRRKNQPPPTAYEDDGLGRTRLFLHMTGTVDEPEVNYDYQAVAKKIAGDFKQQKQELRDAIRKEFNPGKAETTQPAGKNSTKFEIEWDEDK